MARPYPDNFERDLSPLSPQSAGSQTPISYSANVNRQKTKKWVEAKPADYGGDDWGDDYYSTSPPPLPKTTGLRQSGQVSQSSSSGGYPNEEVNKKAYGDLPSLPIEAPARSATNPIRDRTNSFTREDERRAFSGSYAEPAQGHQVSTLPTMPQSNQPPALQVSTQIPAVTGLRKAVQPSFPLVAQPIQGANQETQADEPQSETSSRYSEATSKYSDVRTPSSDFQTRRDFSPSAVPPPLQARHSPGPQSAATDSPASRFPPRKSSISQPISPEVFQQSQTTQEVSVSKPWTEARSSSPGAAAQSPTNTGKGHPFIRPADIYRRMEEEREKERQSLDSSRPSMESIVGGNAGERPNSPAKAPVWGQSTLDGPSGSLNHGAIQESGDRFDSNQYLAPMLEPIQERKSEYGFENYDASQFLEPSREKKDIVSSKESHAERLSPEEMRRYSTSPKLPDLNRISGFGLDLFSQSGTGDPSFEDSIMRSIPESGSSRKYDESNLYNPPFLSHTSVAQQSPEPKRYSETDTLVSESSDKIQRTGSEDTTTRISPIMSKFASTTPSNILEGALTTHEDSVPSSTKDDELENSKDSPDFVGDISERPLIPRANEETGGITTRQAHTTHHINMNASATRTPNITVSEELPLTAGTRISTTPDSAISPVDEELPEPSRPFVERERSFRPNLPGGWVSYATTATDTTADQDLGDNQPVETYNRRTDPIDAPVSPISESEGDDDNDVDLTPTTAKRSVPQSAIGAAAGAALGGVAAATFGRRDKGALNNVSADSALIQDAHPTPSNNALLTPDPALAPIANPYAASTLDPRLQNEPPISKSILAVPDIASHVPASITPTEPPTPPPKDTPADEASHINMEYFPPTVPLKHKTLDEVATSETLALPMRPQMLPSLSTHTSPQDEESDKLRKEIIKSLSPNVSDAEARSRLNPPEFPDNYQPEDHTTLGARESTYLPSEYDNYWETTNDAELQEREEEAKIQGSGFKHEAEPHQSVQNNLVDQGANQEVTPPIPPLSPQRAERTFTDVSLQRPSMPSNRFSWEAGPEEVSSTAEPMNAQLQVPISGIDPRYASTPDSQLQQLEKTREAYFEQGPISTSGNSPALGIIPTVQGQENNNFVVGNAPIEQRRSGGQDPSQSEHEREAAIAGATIAGAAAYAGHQSSQTVAPQRSLSLAEEKSPANASTYAVSPTPPEDEHPARVSHPTIPPSFTEPAASTKPEVADPVPMSQMQNTPDLTKIMQFRDIIALQNPEQRIQAYNDTRDQFAAMDTGLASWLTFVGMNRPDLPPGSQPELYNTGDGAEISKIPKLSSAGVPGTPLQQPYYQQYLNASPISSVPSMTRSGTGIISGSQQGFSASGGKQSGQQPQTKSKDLLHSAGVFGGKASKAGKGLFSKGKNKLRGSGGGDKDSPPFEATPATRPKANEGRTSSWNLSLSSLTLPRSSARTSTPSQHSREATPPPLQRQSQPGQTTPQRQSQLETENRPLGSAGQMDSSIWDAPVSAASTPSVQHSTLRPLANDESLGSRRFVDDGLPLEQDENKGKLSVPAPIGKNQPTWNPHNATPIAEEDGFQYEERSTKQPLAIMAATNPVNIPHGPVNAGRDQSTVENLASVKTLENPLDADDWVVISNEDIPKLSELSFAAPAILQSSTEYTNMSSQHGTGFHPPGAPRTSADTQPRPTFQPAARYEASTGLQPPANYQQPGIPQPPSTIQSAADYPQPTGLPGPNQLPDQFQPPTISQPQILPQAGFRGRFIQHIRQRSSKDGSMPVASRAELVPTAKKVEQFQTADNNKSLGQHPTDFVGLPPIRRSSTFGLGFRAKDPSRRFTLDDDDDDDVHRELAKPSGAESDHNLDRQVIKTVVGADPPSETTRQYDGRPSGGEIALGASAIAAAIGDRMNQPSGEPSRYPPQDSKLLETQTESQQRPPLSNVSSDYSRPSSFSPVSPPVSSPVSPPGSRPPFAVISQRDAVGSPSSQLSSGQQPNSQRPSGQQPNGQQPNGQQSFPVQDHRPDVDWRSNIKQSQEQRVSSLNSYQRSLPLETQRGSSQNTHMVIHPRHPSFDGQRPANPPSHVREPPFDGQRLRSPASSNQGIAVPLPTLGNGVFVPPSRTIVNQQKPFDQPPSSAQRYPALFRAEQGGTETSIDDLPSHYYQAPISKEDAFLPRQQTNEYQLPGVGPPPDQPLAGKRNSKRNSALFKELGGRLSRSASRDRDSILDDDARSPVRPVDSRDSQSRDYSVASINSEDMEEKKKRKSGLSFLGGLRREPTGSIPPSRESLVTHPPVSRTDSLLQQQPQPSSSPLVPPDKKKMFFSSNRSSPDLEKPKTSKLLRVSTGGAISEQPGKKKRFSGITSMFSKGTEYERRGSSGSAGQPGQDTRNQQQSAPPLQGPHNLEYLEQQKPQENMRIGEIPRPLGREGPSSQALSQPRQEQQLRGPQALVYAGQSPFQPKQMAQGMQIIQRQESPSNRAAQMAQPLPSPSLLNPTLQTSFIETRPVQERHSPLQYSSNSQGLHGQQRQPARPDPLFQSTPVSQDSQGHQRQVSGPTPPSQMALPINASQSLSSRDQQASNASQPKSIPQIIPNLQSSLKPNSQTSVPAHSGSMSQPVTSPKVQSHQQQLPAVSQPGSQSVASSQNPQSQASQRFLGHRDASSSEPLMSQPAGQFAEDRGNYQPNPGTANRGLPKTQPLQTTQYQQRESTDLQQNNLRQTVSPQWPPRTSQERQHILVKQSPIQGSLPKMENKSRQGSTAKLFGGLIGGRRSSAQQVKPMTETPVGANLQTTMPRGQQQQQQRHPQFQQQQWQQQQQMSPNAQVQRMSEQNQQRGRPASQEPQYAPLPIPGAYNLVRGEGGRLAPTPYDPRGLNVQSDSYSNQQFVPQEQPHSYSSQTPQIQTQAHLNDHHIMANRFGPPQNTINAPQNMNREGRPNPGSLQNSQNGNKSNRLLSSEDLVARSPARPQFGQQAPYQLSLPDENADSGGRNHLLSTENSALSERHLPSDEMAHLDSPPTNGSLPAQQASPLTTNINTNQQPSNPSLRHPLSPATYPLPEHAPFSPINPEAAQMAPPPPPKWPQQDAPLQNLDRSNTINTHGSEVSQLSGGQLSVPGISKPKEQERPASVTPPSPQITPNRSPEQISRHIAPSPQEEDVYSASPRQSMAMSANTPDTIEGPQQSPEKIPAGEQAPMNRRRRTSQEEKILVEEGMVRPGSEQEELPSMSATSYPGQEWHPYGNGYEEWD